MCESPNDLKLSDRPGWRGPCAAGGEGGGQEAVAVTAGPVRCSAWLAAFVRIGAQWENRAKQNFILGDAVSEARAMTYTSCAAEIRAILDALERDSLHIQPPVEESNSRQEP